MKTQPGTLGLQACLHCCPQALVARPPGVLLPVSSSTHRLEREDPSPPDSVGSKDLSGAVLATSWPWGPGQVTFPG